MTWHTAERKHIRAAITNEQKAAVIEDFIANGLPLKLIAVEHDLEYTTVTTAVTDYFRKPEFDMVLKSKV